MIFTDGLMAFDNYVKNDPAVKNEVQFLFLIRKTIAMAGTRQFDEVDMLEKALALFWKKGYRATSMMDLAKASGVQRGSLYNAYGSKRVIFIKAFCQHSQKVIEQVERTLADPNLTVAITAFFEFMVQRLCNDPERKGCFSTRIIMEATERDGVQEDSAILEQLTVFLNDLEQRIVNRLTLAQEAGCFDGDCRATAQYLMAIARGMAVMERIYFDRQRLQTTYRMAIEMLPIDEVGA